MGPGEAGKQMGRMLLQTAKPGSLRNSWSQGGQFTCKKTPRRSKGSHIQAGMLFWSGTREESSAVVCIPLMLMARREGE